MSEQKRHDEIVISVEGTLDPMAASLLRSRLTAAHASVPVVLDFGHARDVHDLGMAVLAHGLVSDHLTVRFRGLSLHHERMLRYLGFDVATLEGSSATGDPVHDHG